VEQKISTVYYAYVHEARGTKRDEVSGLDSNFGDGTVVCETLPPKEKEFRYVQPPASNNALTGHSIIVCKLGAEIHSNGNLSAYTG